MRNHVEEKTIDKKIPGVWQQEQPPFSSCQCSRNVKAMHGLDSSTGCNVQADGDHQAWL